jgi:hypothetical protein
MFSKVKLLELPIGLEVQHDMASNSSAEFILPLLDPCGLLWPNCWWRFKYGVESSQRVRPALHLAG